MQNRANRQNGVKRLAIGTLTLSLLLPVSASADDRSKSTPDRAVSRVQALSLLDWSPNAIVANRRQTAPGSALAPARALARAT